MANVKYKYLGYGRTNNNGVATLDYDANGDPLQNSGLVGTGAGKLDIVGSLDDLSNIRINYSPSTITDTGGTYTLSATVTNNNVAVNGETVCFNLYKVSDGSLVDTVTGVTNSSGVVSVSYVGKDAGELYIKLERMNQSETYGIIDGTYKDSGTDVPKTAKWYNQNSAFTVTPSANGTSISVADTSLRSLFASTSTTWGGNFVYNSPLCVEFDIVGEVTGAISLYVMNSDNTQFISHGIETTGSGHYKFIIDGEYIHKMKDGAYITPKYAKTMDSVYAIGFRATNGSLTYKNFVIYPI